MGSRDHHRIRPGQEGLLQADLVLANGAGMPGALVGVRPTGVTVRFQRHMLPGIALHLGVVLRFTSPRMPMPVELAMSADGRYDDGLSTTYDFTFSHPQVAEEQLLRHCRAMFDDRTAFRAEPDANSPILATLESEPDGQRITGKLLDLSMRGLALRIHSQLEAQIAATWNAKVEFNLPVVALMPISLAVVIRRRRPNGKDIELGCEFRQVDSLEFRSQQEWIGSWVRMRELVCARRPAALPARPRRTNPAA